MSRDRSPRHKRSTSRSRGRSRRRSFRSENSNDGDAVNSGGMLYVSRLSYEARERDLRGVFEKFGALESCTVIIDPITQESRGFAFVKYQHVGDAEKAIQEVQGLKIKGREIVIEKAKRQGPRKKTPGVYMGKRKRERSKRRSRERTQRRRSRSRDRYRSRSRSYSRDRKYRSEQDSRRSRRRFSSDSDRNRRR